MASYEQKKLAIELAIERVLLKGGDDVFRPPTFSRAIELKILEEHKDEFRNSAYKEALKFLNVADLTKAKIGQAHRSLVVKDKNSFRQCAWLDPFDAVKFLATSQLLFPAIEAARISKDQRIIHSHRKSDAEDELFDPNFGYDSFRERSSEISKARIGQWKVVTDISNFFDRIGNHSLENHLLDIGGDPDYVKLIREMLFFWARDRRSYGIPVGSDASRILSEAILIDIDNHLHAKSIQFIRYVDDYRIFTDTRADALKAIEILTDKLSDEGLSLNSKKTDVFKIIDPEEVAEVASEITKGEHSIINLDEKIEIVRRIKVSGRSSISRFYKEPGKDALILLAKLDLRESLIQLKSASDSDAEILIRKLVKHFIYVEQNVDTLSQIINVKLTAIFYITDALVKEHHRFDEKKNQEIKDALFECVDWTRCPYPIQIPVLRLAATTPYRDPKFVSNIIDNHLQSENMLFYREAIFLGAPCLDRARIRKLAIDQYENLPPFLKRTVYSIVKTSDALTQEEKRPILKNMEMDPDDWYISIMANA